MTTNKQINFLVDIFLIDPETFEDANIINVLGAESGYDHLRICTQTECQEENGLATMYKIYAEEVERDMTGYKIGEMKKTIAL